MLRQAKFNDIEDLVKIHLATLGDGLLAKLGKKFLKQVFFPHCLQTTGVLILVYEQQKKITSFVIYASNGKMLTSSLYKYRSAIVLAILKNILIKPTLVLDIIMVLKGYKISLESGHEGDLNRLAELYLIGTDPAYQGRGIGATLVTKGLTEFSKQFSISNCIVRTSSSKAYRFYMANQFKKIGVEYRGRTAYQILVKECI